MKLGTSGILKHRNTASTLQFLARIIIFSFNSPVLHCMQKSTQLNNYCCTCPTGTVLPQYFYQLLQLLLGLLKNVYH